MFNDIGNTPSTMAAARAAVACAAVDAELSLLQSDCKRAYTQARFECHPTFVRLPKKWWPEHWKRFKNPVCRLDFALYGHPKAGDIWGDRLEQVLVDERGFEAIEGWPSVYIKRFPNAKGGKPGVLVIIAYVDDLLFLGTPHMHAEIAEIRKSIKMDDPSPLQK